MNATKIPKNVTVWEGGRRHKGEIPGRLADNIAKIEERESSKTRETGKHGTFTDAITKAQSILDKQKKKSEKKSETVNSRIPEKREGGDNSLKNPEKK